MIGLLENKCKRTLTEVNVIAVACAAMFVPFLVFLNPSIPHDRYILTSPEKNTFTNRLLGFYKRLTLAIKGNSLVWLVVTL